MCFSTVNFKPIILSSAIFIVTACGGGGGGSSTPAAPTDVSGTVTAPSGNIVLYENKSMFAKAMDILIPSADAITGTAPVAGATVELIEINNAGAQVGDVIDMTTTESDGSYTLSTTRALNTNLVIRVLSNTGTSTEIRAFVVADMTDIGPSSELVVAKVLETIATTTGASLEHFSAAEIEVLTGVVDALSINLENQTIADAMNTLETSAGVLFDEAILTNITTDFSGTWYHVSTATSSSCPNEYPAGTVAHGSSIVIQDGVNITITDTSCMECVTQGTVLDNTVTWSGTYPDDQGTSTESGSVTISEDGLTATGSNTITYTETGFSCTITQNVTASRTPLPL